ncbi:interferon-induced protein 44-like isoform X2 [Mya arenaria]|uniref:interferon-induced protein 44-like isoform X2 n=1 Tax=Mya arenaria TaxID=6604 RepID=UPI0022E1CE37|nr:interferon-induced protein 44-like isoform X2 [Mya arenaria]
MASKGRLSDDQKNQLEQWIGQGHKDFVLLFSFSIDGGTASAFHNKCNNQGPTVTVIHNEHKSVYGGYTSQSWTSCDDNVTDQQAFLYQLQFSGDIKCNKFPVSNHSRALIDVAGCGPIFGRGRHDLWTFNSATKIGGFYKLVGSRNGFGTDYNVSGTKATQVNNDTKSVEELEVYKVVDCSGNCARHVVPKPIEEKPWRKTTQWSQKKMLEDIASLKPVSGLGVNDFRIAMFGPVGEGKSSCVNSLLSTFAGRISQRASTGCGRTGTTTLYTPYPLKSSSGSSANIRVYDTPGFTEASGLDLIDFYHILEGHVCDHFMFHPSTHITWKSEKFVQKPTMSHRIHCGAIVIGATTVDAFTDENTSKLKALKSLMDEKGIPCVALLTKIDKIAPELEDNWKTTFKDPKVKECVEKAATVIGISRNNVHPVKNYEIEVEVDEDLNVLSLLALRQIIHLSMDHMENVKLRDGGNDVAESAEAVGSDTA